MTFGAEKGIFVPHGIYCHELFIIILFYPCEEKKTLSFPAPSVVRKVSPEAVDIKTI